MLVTLPMNHIVMPDVRCDLIWTEEQLLLLGPLTHARLTGFPGKKLRILNIDPIKAGTWLGLPSIELTNHTVPFGDIAPQVLSAGWMPDARVAAAASQLTKGSPVNLAAKEAGLSERQLERLFRDQMGVSTINLTLVATCGHFRAERPQRCSRMSETFKKCGATDDYAGRN